MQTTSNQPAVSANEQRLLDALQSIVRETMDYPPVRPVSSDSHLPDEYITFAQQALAAYGAAITPAFPDPTTPPAIGQYWPAQGGIYLGIAEAEPASGPADCATPALPRRHVVMLHDANTPAGDDGADPIKCWDKAAGWAAAQGNGARLPTRIEAIMARQCEAARATFDKDSYYWTCTQNDRNCAFFQSFGYGSSTWLGKASELWCRAFRGLALQTFSPLQG